jgi:gliding motility-associated-like protein
MNNRLSHFLFLILISFSNIVLGQSLVNGDFETGGNGFGFLINGAGYSQINPLTGTSAPGNFAITTNPQLLNSNFNSGGDHTSGSGKMLVVDGNTTAGSRLWSCTSTGGALTGFTPGLTYTFSYWIKSVSNDVTNNATQAYINVFFVNAININPTNTYSYAPIPVDGWTRVSYTFTANANNILIELKNNNTSALGNDFALDDFVIVQGSLPLTLTQTSINPTCPSSLDGSIKGVGSGGVLPFSFSLATATFTISNSTGIFNNLLAGTYTLSIQDAVGASVPPIILILNPPNDITINPPVTICAGSPTNLSVSGSPDPYLWTANPPDSTLTTANNTSATPTVSPTITTVYTVTSGVVANPTNLIVNGDFTLGNTGFLSDYTYYNVGTVPSSGQQGAYGVATNSRNWFNNFSSCLDHTIPNGNMLVADGSTTGTARVWHTQTPITVLPGKNYTFSYFLTSVVNSGPAKLEVLINNVSLGTPATAPNNTCLWEEHSYVWNSGTNTTATISIIDREMITGGNDFAIDDLNFKETPSCIYQKAVTITVNPNVAPTIGTIIHPTCSTAGSVILNGLPAGNWTINPGGITGNTSSVTIPNLISGTYNFTVTNSYSCVSAPVSVVINPIPNALNPAFNSIAPVCVGTTISLPLSSINGITGTWLPSFNPNTTTTYTFTPDAGQCANPTTIQVVVSQIPDVNASPTSETICSLQSTGIALSSLISTTTFNWTATATDVSGESSGTGNVISQVLTSTSNQVGNVQYTITPTNNGCSGTPINVNVMVTPKPTLIATAATTSICSGSTTAINLAGSIIGSTNFSWNLIQNNVTGGSIGTGNVIAHTLSTINTSSGEAVYAITPEVNGCRGITATISIIVNPIPVAIINPVAGQNLCSGQTTAISFSSPVINTIFNWTVNQTNLNGTSAGSGTSIAQVLSVILPSVGTATYEVIPNSNGCAGIPVQVSVNVKPIPDFTVIPSQAPICSGDSTSIVLSPSLSGTTLTWTVVQNGVIGALGDLGTTIVQVLETTENAVGNAIYTITPELNGCFGTPVNVTAIVNPLPRPSLTGGTICVNTIGPTYFTYKTYTLNSGLNNTDYTFQWFLNGVLQAGSTSSFVAVETGNYSVIATNIATGCISSSVFATVVPSVRGTSISAVGSFAFDQNASITVTALVPNPNYQYALDYGALQYSNVFTDVNPGSHLVTVTDTNGCTNLSTTVFIIGYPTFFTPNSDGFNDYWNIIGLENQPTANIFIFDRYGKLLKQISSKSLGWDGTYLGAPLPTSDYWFTVEYIEPLTSELKVFKSHFSLKR